MIFKQHKLNINNEKIKRIVSYLDLITQLHDFVKHIYVPRTNSDRIISVDVTICTREHLIKQEIDVVFNYIQIVII